MIVDNRREVRVERSTLRKWEVLYCIGPYFMWPIQKSIVRRSDSLCSDGYRFAPVDLAGGR